MENTYLKEEVKSEFEYDQIIGNSIPMSALQQKLSMISQAESPVLIQGETGTGKELIARAIHEQSPRAHQPLIKVNCCAIPNELFESEFFGHAKGAFTGALRDREGRFQLADGGSLFLDEIAEIPLNLQGKLLRVLQEGTFERVGEEKTRTVDVRIIAATNCNLRQEVDEGRFRSDLFYRLSVIPLEIPPLREREGDVRLLADHFWTRQMRNLRKPCIKFSENDYQILERYSWPGNIRELQNVIERVSIITPPDHPINWDMAFFSSGLELHEPSIDLNDNGKIKNSESEKKRILSALEKTNWKVYGPRGAAEFLHIKPTTLAYRIKKLGLKKPGSRTPSS